MAENDPTDEIVRKLATLIDEGESSGEPLEIDAESFLKLSREDRLRVLQTELT